MLEAFFGMLGESYEVGLLIEAPVSKPKATLGTGIETKAKEAAVVRKKGPGRIASLFHLTRTGRILLEANRRDAIERGANISLRDEIAMKNMLAQPKHNETMRAHIVRMGAEALSLLNNAGLAWSVVVAEEKSRERSIA